MTFISQIQTVHRESSCGPVAVANYYKLNRIRKSLRILYRDLKRKEDGIDVRNVEKYFGHKGTRKRREIRRLVKSRKCILSYWSKQNDSAGHTIFTYPIGEDYIAILGYNNEKPIVVDMETFLRNYNLFGRGDESMLHHVILPRLKK